MIDSSPDDCLVLSKPNWRRCLDLMLSKKMQPRWASASAYEPISQSETKSVAEEEAETRTGDVSIPASSTTADSDASEDDEAKLRRALASWWSTFMKRQDLCFFF